MEMSPRSSASAESGVPRPVAAVRPRRRRPAALVPVLGLLALGSAVWLTGPATVATSAAPVSSGVAVGVNAGVEANVEAGAPLADPSPTPTLGATESPNPNPPGDNDGDASDFSGTIWILPAVLLLAAIAGAVLILRARSRRS